MCISLLSLHDYDVKMANFIFYGGCTQTTTKFFFLFLYFQGVTRKSYPLSSQSERVIL